MHIFLTGATGYIGSAILQELLRAGHQVLALSRSSSSSTTLLAAGATPHLGSLSDLDSLKRGASSCDAVIHTAFHHDFSSTAAFVAACEVDRRAIEALGSALEGSGKRLIVTTGTGVHINTLGGRALTEEDLPSPGVAAMPRVASEEAALSFVSRGVRVAVIRLPPTVHGDGDHHGFIPMFINLAREKGISAYMNDGLNRWPAVHMLDIARLYRLVVENEEGSQGPIFHGVAEEGVPFRDIAESIGRNLQVPVVAIKAPEEAAEHFGWFANIVAINNPTSSARTVERLGWLPEQLELIADMESGKYFQVV